MTAPEGPSRPGGRQRRPGSRVLLALALAAATCAGMYAGALIADSVTSLFGVASVPFRLLLKVLLMAAALPAAFYVVERFFLLRSSRTRASEDRRDP